jgi:hypothetical protein
MQEGRVLRSAAAGDSQPAHAHGAHYRAGKGPQQSHPPVLAPAQAGVLRMPLPGMRAGGNALRPCGAGQEVKKCVRAGQWA